MRFCLDTALLTCKRLFRRPGIWMITALLPLVCGLAGLYFSAGGEIWQVRVGVVIHEGDLFGEGIYEGLGRFESPILFVRYGPEDIPYLEREVAGGRLACAYLIAPDLGDRLNRGRAIGGITLIRSPQTVVDILAGEMILASVLRQAAPEINRGLLTELLEIPPDLAEEMTRAGHAYYDARPELFLEPVFAYANGQGAGEPSPPPGGRLLYGLIALFGLAGVIWSLPAQIREAPGILRRLPPGSAVAYVWGTGLGIWLCGLAAGTLGLLAAALTHPAVGFLGLPFLLTAGYLLALSMGGMAVVLLLKRPDLVYGGGGFALILTAALGGVFVDLGEINRLVGRVSLLFPSWYYMRGLAGGGPVILLLLLAFAAAGGLISAFLAGRVRR